MKLDNNTLSVILVLAIVVSVAVLFYNSGLMGISGAATSDTGPVNFTITGQVSIVFLDDSTDFGSGYPDPGSIALLQSNGTGYVENGSWSESTDSMVLNNDGNRVANVTLTSSKTPEEFIGHASADFHFIVADSANNATACGDNQASTFTQLSTSAVAACNNFDFNDSHDTIDIDYQLTIPAASTVGSKTTTITANAIEANP